GGGGGRVLRGGGGGWGGSRPGAAPNPASTQDRGDIDGHLRTAACVTGLTERAHLEDVRGREAEAVADKERPPRLGAGRPLVKGGHTNAVEVDRRQAMGA